MLLARRQLKFYSKQFARGKEFNTHPLVGDNMPLIGSQKGAQLQAAYHFEELEITHFSQPSQTPTPYLAKRPV